MLIDYSIVVCTYNPDQSIFRRCLKAIENLDKDGLSVEILLVDNNSSNSIEHLESVRSILNNEPLCRLIIVKEQGLTHARTAGIEAAQGKNIIFCRSAMGRKGLSGRAAAREEI